MIKRIIFIYILTFISCDYTREAKYNNIDIVSLTEIKASNDIIILDVRTEEERKKGFLYNSTHIDYYDDLFHEKINLLDKEKSIYIYCKVGGRSSKAAEKITQAGFKKAYNLEGGFMKWVDHSLPIESDSYNNLSQEFNSAYLDSVIALNKNTLIYVSTKWCAPCKEMNLLVDRFLVDFSDKLEIVRLDLDKNTFLKDRYSIKSIPLFVLYKNNQVVWSKNGIIAYNDIAEKIQVFKKNQQIN